MIVVAPTRAVILVVGFIRRRAISFVPPAGPARDDFLGVLLERIDNLFVMVDSNTRTFEHEFSKVFGHLLYVIVFTVSKKDRRVDYKSRWKRKRGGRPLRLSFSSCALDMVDMLDSCLN